jgi:hypothetical protein
VLAAKLGDADADVLGSHADLLGQKAADLAGESALDAEAPVAAQVDAAVGLDGVVAVELATVFHGDFENVRAADPVMFGHAQDLGFGGRIVFEVVIDEVAVAEAAAAKRAAQRGEHNGPRQAAFQDLRSSEHLLT